MKNILRVGKRSILRSQSRYMSEGELKYEVQQRTSIREEHKLSTDVANVYEKWRRDLNKAEKRRNYGDCEIILRDMYSRVRVFDPPPPEGMMPVDVDMIAWAAYVQDHPSVFSLFISLLNSKSSDLMETAAILFARTLEWSPEVVPSLLEDPSKLLEPLLKGCQYFYRQQKAVLNQSNRRSFHGLLLCLYECMKTISGNPRISAVCSEIIKSHHEQIIDWWRSAYFSDKMQAAVSPLATVSHCLLLSELLAIFPQSCKLVTAADLANIEVAVQTAPMQLDNIHPLNDYFTNAKVNIAYELIGTLMFARYTLYEDYSFLNDLLDAGWHIRFATLTRSLKWGSSITLAANSRTMAAMMRGASTLAIRWPQQTWQAELPQIAVDKIRYAIGFLQESLRDEDDKSVIQTIKSTSELVIEPALNLVSEWCIGELLDQQYNPAAYNAERVSCIRFVHFPGIMSRVLRIYPKNERIIRSTFAPIRVLMGFAEQAYDVRDVKLFQSLEKCRSYSQSKELQKEILDIMLVIKDRVPA